MNETKLNGESMDVVADNVQKLKNIFPEVFCEDSIDFEKLQAVLGNYIDTDNERYNFTWWGKSQALRLAQTPSTGTLRPCKEESKDWDTTQNLYIEGDNLEVLKLLQKTYHGKVKMIYIDPPYNTGKDFVYPDNYKDNLQNYLEITNQIDKEGNKVATNNDTNGRYHTNWLNMIYPRLRLARNLLHEEGAIFISIDDKEVDNLKKVCSEIFGEENFVGCISRATGTTTGQDANKIGSSIDYCLVYSKSSQFILKGLPMDEKDLKRFNEKDEKGQYSTLQLRKTGNNDTKEDRPNMFYPVIAPDGSEVYPFGPTGYLSRWRVGKDTYSELLNNNMIVWKENESIEYIEKDGYVKSKWTPYVKYYLEGRTKQVSNLFQDIEGNKKGSLVLKELLGGKGIFDNPKPVEFLTKLLQIASEEDSIILDFFSGSATTAHAILEINACTNSKRKFILVQFPEVVDEKSEAYKNGYKNICEIGKERIRKAGDKVKNGGEDKFNFDVGFKVFKLDTSNIKKWTPDYDNLEQTLFDQINNFVEGRTELDVVFEIMLKYGIDLTFPIEEYDVAGKKVYSVGFGALIICLDNDITTDLAMGIIKLKEELSPDIMRVVFKDNGFRNDAVKTNVKEIFKVNGIDEMVSI